MDIVNRNDIQKEIEKFQQSKHACIACRIETQNCTVYIPGPEDQKSFGLSEYKTRVYFYALCSQCVKHKEWAENAEKLIRKIV